MQHLNKCNTYINKNSTKISTPVEMTAMKASWCVGAFCFLLGPFLDKCLLSLDYFQIGAGKNKPKNILLKSWEFFQQKPSL